MNIRLVTNTVLILCGIIAATVLVLFIFVVDDFHGKTETTTGVIVLKKQTSAIKKINRNYYSTQNKKTDSLSVFNQHPFYFTVAIGGDTVILKIVSSLYLKKQVGDTLELLKTTGYFSNRARYYLNE